MYVLTREQKDFALLVINRQIQNRVLSAFDTNLQMLLQGSQLSPGTAKQSLTNCLADSMRTTFSLENKNLPATVSQQGYTDMINAIRLVASQKPENIVAKFNWVMSKFKKKFAQAENSAKQITSMECFGRSCKD